MSTIQFRTDNATKTQANAVFGQLGITMSDALNMFLHQSILHGGLPFELKIPDYKRYNLTTITAINEMEQSKGKGIRGVDVHSALAALKSEEDDE